MALRDPKSGPSNVAEYQISSLPWLTSSTVSAIKEHRFPKATSFILLKNTSSGSMDFAFTYNGFASNNKMTLETSESISIDVRTTQFFISGAYAQEYSLYAGLTGIDRNNFPILTGSSFATGSDGWVYWEGIG